MDQYVGSYLGFACGYEIIEVLSINSDTAGVSIPSNDMVTFNGTYHELRRSTRTTDLAPDLSC